ncbi:MAG: hypothetical protein QXU32_12850 [Nitrososphaerales archaeon]
MRKIAEGKIDKKRALTALAFVATIFSITLTQIEVPNAFGAVTYYQKVPPYDNMSKSPTTTSNGGCESYNSPSFSWQKCAVVDKSIGQIRVKTSASNGPWVNGPITKAWVKFNNPGDTPNAFINSQYVQSRITVDIYGTLYRQDAYTESRLTQCAQLYKDGSAFNSASCKAYTTSTFGQTVTIDVFEVVFGSKYWVSSPGGTISVTTNNEAYSLVSNNWRSTNSNFYDSFNNADIPRLGFRSCTDLSCT